MTIRYFPKLLALSLFIIFTCKNTFAENESQNILKSLPPPLAAEAEKTFQLSQKKTLSLSEMDQVLKWLHSHSDFDQVQLIENEKDGFQFKIIPTVRIQKITVAGDKSFSKNDILAIYGVTEGSILDANNLIEGGERIKQYYHDAGFLNTTVELEFPPISEKAVQVNIKIIENTRTRIKNIQFISENINLNELLKKKTSSFIDDPFTEQNISEIQKKVREILTKDRYFRADIFSPEVLFSNGEADATLSFKIEKANKYTLSINGNREYSLSDLEDTLDLDSFYSSHPNISAEVANRLKNFYLSRGYARVDVQAQESPGREPLSIKLQVEIQEGPRVRIADIQFTGRLSKESDEYKKWIENKSLPLIQKGYYVKLDLDQSLELLKTDLQNQGYLLAKIISTRTQYNKTRDRVSVFVNLDEGPLTILKDVQFQGNDSFNKEELLKVVDLNAETPLQLNKLEASITKLKDYYKERGYLEMVLINEKDELVRYDESNTQARVNYKIYEGPKVQVASISIEGLTTTKEKIVRIELEFKEGDILTPSRIEESIARLQRTGYFSTVEIKTLEEKTSVAQRTVIVRVNERDPGLFSVGAGLTNERGVTLRGFAGLGYRNIAGTGRGASIRSEGNYNFTQIKFPETKITIGYLEPYLFDSRVRARANITRSKTVSDLSEKLGYETNQYTYSVEKDFTSHVTFIYDLLNIAQVNYFFLDSGSIKQRQDIASTGPTIDIDYRDNPFNPSKGIFARFNFEYATPWLGSSDTIEYYRTTGSFTHYQPFWTTWVWANSIRGGYLENLSKRADGGVPYDRKGFILGGRSTIRGFETGTFEVLPSSRDLGIGDTDIYYLKSSATMSLIKSELRFPLWGNIGGSLFYDGGMVKISGLDFADNYRDSVGFGFRYITPVGPVNAEVGFKLDRKPSEDLLRFHFSVGSF
jgi:outer membrane protein insertion porin family